MPRATGSPTSSSPPRFRRRAAALEVIAPTYLSDGRRRAGFDDLRATAKAYIRVRRCDVERLPKATGDSRGVPPQLGADCTVEWITLRERKGT